MYGHLWNKGWFHAPKRDILSQLRHNYCTNLCYQIPTISIKKIAELLGDHEKMVIEVYNHIILEKEDAEKAVEQALNAWKKWDKNETSYFQNPLFLRLWDSNETFTLICYYIQFVTFRTSKKRRFYAVFRAFQSKIPRSSTHLGITQFHETLGIRTPDNLIKSQVLYRLS